MATRKERLERVSQGQSHVDTAHAHRDLCGHFQEPQPDRPETGARSDSASQGERAQSLQEQVAKAVSQSRRRLLAIPWVLIRVVWRSSRFYLRLFFLSPRPQ